MANMPTWCFRCVALSLSVGHREIMTIFTQSYCYCFFLYLFFFCCSSKNKRTKCIGRIMQINEKALLIFTPACCLYWVGFMERGTAAVSLSSTPPLFRALLLGTLGKFWGQQNVARHTTMNGMCEINVTNFNAALTKRQRQKQYKSTTTTIATTTIVIATTLSATIATNNSRKFHFAHLAQQINDNFWF